MQSESAKRGSRVEVQPVDDAIPEAGVIEEKPITGVVTDCLKLNVRKAPSINAEVAAVIPALTEVVIDMDKSTADFYRVSATDGIQGFCMKKFIAVRQ